jgi:hypothetical protein
MGFPEAGHENDEFRKPHSLLHSIFEARILDGAIHEEVSCESNADRRRFP